MKDGMQQKCSWEEFVRWSGVTPNQRSIENNEQPPFGEAAAAIKRQW